MQHVTAWRDARGAVLLLPLLLALFGLTPHSNQEKSKRYAASHHQAGQLRLNANPEPHPSDEPYLKHAGQALILTPARLTLGNTQHAWALPVTPRARSGVRQLDGG